ncbi:MAG: S-layer homology domain-containing protein [Symbiobacteriia bacterium]
MTKRLFRPVLALLLTVAMLFGSASVALAKSSASKGHGSRFSGQFKDWNGTYWANESLARMIVKGVMKGESDGSGLNVQPNRPVTRLEAAVMLVRLLGLDQAATVSNPVWPEPIELEYEDGKVQYKSEFDDDDDIPLWGRDAVAIALEKGFLVFEGHRLNPLTPLKRVEAAVMLVKAAGLEAEAQSQAGAALPFKDAAAISYTAKGYVAVALQHGLVNGMPDGTFQPNKPVTRAEWAAMLDRFDRTRTDDQNQVKGKITAVNQSGTALPTISMTTPVFPNGVTYSVADQAAFFVNGNEATIADLHVGDQVLVQLNATRQITMVTVVTQSPATNIAGTVAAFTAPIAATTLAGGQNGTIILQSTTGAGQAYAVAPDASVRLGVTSGTFADVHADDPVVLSLQNGIVRVITINVVTQTIQGTVKATTVATLDQPATLTLTTAAGATTAYTLAGNVTIVSAAGTNLAFADVHVGDQVELQVQRNLVVRINVLQTTAIRTISGSLSALTIGSAATPSSLTVNASGTYQTLQVAANATVTYSGQALTLADLRLGDTISLTVQNNVVTAIVVTQRTSTALTLTGLVSNLGASSSSFTLTSGASAYTVMWNTATVFTNQGQPATAAALANGQQVKATGTLLSTTLLLTSLDIQVAQTSVSGAITSLTNNTGTTADALTLTTTSGATAMYQVSSTAGISWNGVPLTFGGLLVGDTVTLTVTNGVVTAIVVTGRQTQAVTLSGHASSLNTTANTFVLTVPGTSGNTAYTVGWSNQTVFTYQGLVVTEAQLANGQQVTVAGKGAGSLVTADRVDIQVSQSNLTGEIANTTDPSGSTPGTITIRNSTATSSYQVLGTATVVWKGLPITWGDLAIGDGVTLTLTNGVVSKIDLTNRAAEIVTMAGTVSGLNATAKTFVLTVQGIGPDSQPYTATLTIGYTDQTTFTYLGLSVAATSLGNGQTVSVTGPQVGQVISANSISIQTLAQ